MLEKLREVISRHSFVKNVLTLMTGTLFAQALSILISPIITRIFSPKDFGLFGAYTAAAMIIGPVVTFKYDLAIVLPKNENDANHLLYLCLAFSSLVSIILLIVVLLFRENLISYFSFFESFWLTLLLPFFVVALGVYQALTQWCIRNKYFKNISLNVALKSIATSILNIIFGFLSFGALGLTLSSFFSYFGANAYLLKKFFKVCQSKVNFNRMRYLAKRYKNCPKFLLPGTIVNLGSKQVPILFFAAYFSAEFVGSLMLAQRIIAIPVSLISKALSQTLLQRTAEEFKTKGNCRNIFLKTLGVLTVLAVPPFLFLFLFGETIFPLAFGEKWIAAGRFVKILVPFYYFYLVAGTLNVVFISSGRQKLDLLMQINYLFFSFLALGAVWFGKLGEKNALQIFVVCNSLAFLIALIIGFYVSGGKKAHEKN